MPRVLKGLGFATLCVATVAIAALPTDPAPDRLTFPQKRGAVYEEIHAHQALGRTAVAPDGSFFLYEWSRPYDWAPDYKGLPKAVAARKQTFIYKGLREVVWVIFDHFLINERGACTSAP